MESVTVKVEGMSCGHCVKAIENALIQIGVRGKVDLNNKIVDVKYDEKKQNIIEIKETIKNLGYIVQ
jgi:copper chaperone